MRGPYNSSVNTAILSVDKTWYRTNLGQKERTPLPYTMRKGEVLLAPSTFLSATWAKGYAPWDVSKTGAIYTSLHNQCYSAWVDKVKGGIQLGVDLAEADQTLRLISSVYRGLRNPIEGLQKLIRRAKKDPWRTPLREIGGAYLAYHFGVEPLIKELYELLDVLDGQFNMKKQITAVKRRTMTMIEKPSNGYWSNHSFDFLVRISGFRHIKDPSWALAASLGVTNPADIAWELVPYSFVVDWFYPVGLYLQQLDNLVGREVTNAYETYYVDGTLESTLVYPQVSYSNPIYGKPFRHKHVELYRTIGLPSPVLQSGFFKWSTSMVRAMTATSLLLQKLPKNH